MKYNYYLQLRDRAEQMIEARVQQLTPRAGNNVSVIGDGISIDPIVRDEEEEGEENWVYILYGRCRSTLSPSGDTFDTGVVQAATVGRVLVEGEDGVQNAISQTSFWEFTQVFSIVPEDPEIEPTNRTIVLDLFVTSNFPGDRAVTSLEEGTFFSGLNVVLELYESEFGEDGPVAQTFELRVGRSGAGRGFSAPSPNTQYRLRVARVERL